MTTVFGDCELVISRRGRGFLSADDKGMTL